MDKRRLTGYIVVTMVAVALFTGCIDKLAIPTPAPSPSPSLSPSPSSLPSGSDQVEEEYPLIGATQREFEDVEDYTAGDPNILRSSASKEKVLGQFGCEGKSPWNPKSGYAKYNNIHFDSTENWIIIIHYSCNNNHSVPIKIYLDDEREPRGIFNPENTHDWNTFRRTDNISLGIIMTGYHSLTFQTDGVRDGVADLDYFVLFTYPKKTAPTYKREDEAHYSAHLACHQACGGNRACYDQCMQYYGY